MPVFGNRMVCETANYKHVQKMKKEMEERESKLGRWQSEKAQRRERLRSLNESIRRGSAPPAGVAAAAAAAATAAAAGGHANVESGAAPTLDSANQVAGDAGTRRSQSVASSMASTVALDDVGVGVVPSSPTSTGTGGSAFCSPGDDDMRHMVGGGSKNGDKICSRCSLM